MKHLVIPTTNVFVIRGSQLLLGRRANTGWMDGYLCLPGGHIEIGETPTIAIMREIEEELGVTARLDDLEFICVAARNTEAGETVAYNFAIRDKDYDFRNNEPEKCSELVWVDINNLPVDIVEQFRPIIEQGFVGKQPYIEVGY